MIVDRRAFDFRHNNQDVDSLGIAITSENTTCRSRPRRTMGLNCPAKCHADHCPGEILTYKIDIPEAHTLQEEYGHELLTALQEMGSRGRAFNGSF